MSAQGAGEVAVDLSGASSLTRLDINAGVGDITVDLTIKGILEVASLAIYSHNARRLI
jgi:hypothetical protein